MAKQDIQKYGGPNKNLWVHETPGPAPLPQIGIAFHITYYWSTKKCFDDYLAGKWDFSFKRLMDAVKTAGIDRDWFCKNIFVTNYIEVIPPTNRRPTEIERAASHKSFENRVKDFQPKVILSLVGKKSGLQGNVRDVARRNRAACVEYVHPSSLRCKDTNPRFLKLIEAIKKACSYLRINHQL